jgi:uncharacterized protein YdhG (YjbR/CyaY superfamily)
MGGTDTMKKPAGTIDEYIAEFPPEIQEILQTLRRTIQESAPEAQGGYQLRDTHLHIDG